MNIVEAGQSAGVIAGSVACAVVLKKATGAPMLVCLIIGIPSGAVLGFFAAIFGMWVIYSIYFGVRSLLGYKTD